MDSKTRNLLAERLAKLPLNERNKLYKRASAQRKLDRRPRQAHGRPTSLEDVVLRLLAEDLEPVAMPEGELRQGVVVWVGSKTCRVTHEDSEVECLLQGHRTAPGDVVTYSAGETVNQIQVIAERRTKLSRPDPDKGHVERVVAANIDAIVIVVSVKTPPLHPRLIDRYLIAIQYGGAEPILAVNKLDLLQPEERQEELAKLDPYRGLDIPIVPVSTQTGEGLAALRNLISGRLTAFVGHSGVGKSSLLNALHPELAIATGEVSRAYGRGTHTTTASTLHTMPDGTRIIDTPGIRSFGLWDVSPQELANYFPEFQRVRCKFSDCSHLHEPGCGVREAVGRGLIHKERFQTYRRLAEGD